MKEPTIHSIKPSIIITISNMYFNNEYKCRPYTNTTGLANMSIMLSLNAEEFTKEELEEFELSISYLSPTYIIN